MAPAVWLARNGDNPQTLSMSRFLADFHKIMDYPFLRLGQSQFTASDIIKLLVLLAVVLLAEYSLRRHFVTRVLRRTRLDPSLQFAVAKIGGYVFIVLGFYISLQVVGINLTSLAVVAGAIGVGIGFGLQNVINNFVSGLIILAERPIAIGDRIEIGGVAGQVRQIRVRSTTVVTNDNIAIIVPNSDFISHTVTNWSYGDPRVRLRLAVSVAYGTDLEKLQRLLLEVAREHPKVLQQPNPAVFFSWFGK